jgi:hypothetical protein
MIRIPGDWGIGGHIERTHAEKESNTVLPHCSAGKSLVFCSSRLSLSRLSMSNRFVVLRCFEVVRRLAI